MPININGLVVLNKTRLDSGLNGGIPGVTAADVKKIFALGADSTNSGISFVLGSSRTKGSTTGYDIDISKAAERAAVTAATTLPASTVITSANQTLEVKLDGKTATVKLSEGTCAAQELANHIESIINSSIDLPGRRIKASLSGGALQLTSETYGTNSDVTIVSGTAVASLGLTPGQKDTGRDIVGAFKVNGKSEAAVGRGQLLTGDPANENTADLQVRITLAPNQVVTGAEGTVTVSRGLTSALDQVLAQMLNTDTGLLKTVNTGYESQLKTLQTSIDRQKTAFDQQTANLQSQFQALESSISQLQTTSNYLGGQLASLPKIALYSSTSGSVGEITMNPRHRYKATQAFSWTRIDMLLLIYDRAVATLNEGAGLLEQNRFTEIPPVSLKAMQSLLMIADGLDLEEGDLPSHVMRLVVFALDQISTPSPGAWRSAAAVMSKLREGFQEIQEQARRDEYEGRIPALDAVS